MKYLAELGNASWQFLKKKADNTCSGDYAPEIEKNPDLEQKLASWYKSLIGMLSLMVELFRVDIITEV